MSVSDTFVTTIQFWTRNLWGGFLFFFFSQSYDFINFFFFLFAEDPHRNVRYIWPENLHFSAADVAVSTVERFLGSLRSLQSAMLCWLVLINKDTFCSSLVSVYSDSNRIGFELTNLTGCKQWGPVVVIRHPGPMSGASSRDRNVWWHDDQLRWLTTSVTDWGWRNRLRCCWHQAILVHRLRLSTCPWNGDVRSWRNCQLSSVQVPTAWLSSLAFLWMVVSFPVTKRCNLLTWFRRLTTAFCFFFTEEYADTWTSSTNLENGL